MPEPNCEGQVGLSLVHCNSHVVLETVTCVVWGVTGNLLSYFGITMCCYFDVDDSSEYFLPLNMLTSFRNYLYRGVQKTGRRYE